MLYDVFVINWCDIRSNVILMLIAMCLSVCRLSVCLSVCSVAGNQSVIVS